MGVGAAWVEEQAGEEAEREEVMKLADLIPFRRRRTLSRYADDKAVQDFERVARFVGRRGIVHELLQSFQSGKPPHRF